VEIQVVRELVVFTDLHVSGGHRSQFDIGGPSCHHLGRADYDLIGSGVTL
jgi:hypothetical protein